MTLARAAVCAMLIASSLGFAVPCRATEDAAAAASAQQRGVLPRGGSYVLDRDPTVAAAAVGLWFRAPGAGYDNTTPGVSRLAATAAAVAPLSSGKSLFQLVQSLGGVLSINVYPDIVGVDAVIPSSAARRVVAAMTAAYFAPVIDDAAVKTAQRDAAVLAVEQRYSPDLTLHDLLFKQLFSEGPAHWPPLPDSVTQITHVGPSDVDTFAKRAFRAGNSVLTLAGNVDASFIDAVTDGGGDASLDKPIDSTLSRPAESATVSGSVDGLGLAWIGPPVADERAATAMDFIADYLFRDRTGVVSKALESDKNDTLLGQFITLHDPGVMLVTIEGDDQKGAKDRVLAEVAKLQQPLDAKTFEAAREAFLYHIASDTQTPPQRADNLGWYFAEGAPNYAPGDVSGAYERTARGLDPAYVASVVKQYLNTPVVVNLLTGPTPKESSS